jgi:hypothetical protein
MEFPEAPIGVGRHGARPADAEHTGGSVGRSFALTGALRCTTAQRRASFQGRLPHETTKPIAAGTARARMTRRYQKRYAPRSPSSCSADDDVLTGSSETQQTSSTSSQSMRTLLLHHRRSATAAMQPHEGHWRTGQSRSSPTGAVRSCGALWCTDKCKGTGNQLPLAPGSRSAGAMARLRQSLIAPGRE